MSHGNGFAIDMYYPLWSRFLEDCDVVVFDLRNHGWNRVGDIARHHVPQIVRDVESVAGEVRRRFGDKPTLGVYHSLSSLSACLSESRGEGYAGLFLLDPPVCKPGQSYTEFDAASERAARLTRRRQVRFESLDQCVELLDFVRTYRKTVPGTTELVARTTLRSDDAGSGVVLRCPRDYEARIIEYLTAFAVLVDFAGMRCPVRVLGADPTLPYSFLPSFDLGAMMACDYDFVPETSHMLFVEQPESCAEHIRRFAADCGLRIRTPHEPFPMSVNESGSKTSRGLK